MTIKENVYTITFGTCGALLFTTSFIYDFDIFERLIDLLEGIESYEIDELIIPCLMLLIGFTLDIRKRAVAFKIQSEQKKVLVGVMINVDHVLRNLLNTLYYFKDIMKDSKDVSSETIALFDKVIAETQGELERIASTEVIPSNVDQQGIVKNRTSL